MKKKLLVILSFFSFLFNIYATVTVTTPTVITCSNVTPIHALLDTIEIREGASGDFTLSGSTKSYIIGFKHYGNGFKIVQDSTPQIFGTKSGGQGNFTNLSVVDMSDSTITFNYRYNTGGNDDTLFLSGIYVMAVPGATADTIVRTGGNGAQNGNAAANGLKHAVVFSSFKGSITKTHITCNGYANGTAIANLTGGTSPFSYAWSPGGATTSSVNSLAVATYSLTVIDNIGCIATASAAITQPTAISTPAFSLTHITCNGAATARINSSVSGGTTPYAYLWSSGQTTANITGLTANTYTLAVTDNNGCPATSSATITQPSALSATTLDLTHISCFGVNVGQIIVNQSGGTLPYSYTWSPSGGTMATAANLSAQSYSVTVKDANNCPTSPVTVSATITQPAALAATVNITAVTCNGLSNGVADVVASGGAGSYTYLWNPGGATTSSINSLAATTYTTTVTDGNGCIATASANITQPSAISFASPNITAVSCNSGNSGMAKVNPSGGTLPYAYLWDNAQTTQTATGLIAASYTATVTDANSCIATTAITITQPLDLSIAPFATTTVSCFGGNNGKAIASASGGTPVYTYSWLPSGGSSATGTNLVVGDYTLTVTDSKNCTATSTVTISGPTTIVIGPFSTTTVSCFGAATGSATVSPTGGTPGYTYKWTNGSTTTTANNLLANVVNTFTVTDANLCRTTSTVSIAQPASALSIAAFSTTSATCFGYNNGIASTTVSGGTPSYVYSWAPTASSSDSRTDLTAGNYTITATDANNCVATRTVSISQSSQLTTALSVLQHVSSYGGSNGVVSSLPGGGTPAYSYSWSNGGITQNISGLSAGTYSLILSDSYSCSTAPVTVSINVTEPLPPALNGGTFISSSSSICSGSGTVVDLNSTAAATGGVSPYNYQWESYDGAVWSPIGGTDPDYSIPTNPSSTTNYRRRVCDSYTVSTTCAYTNTVTLTIMALPTVSFSFAEPQPFLDSIAGVASPPITMTATVNPGGGSGSFSGAGVSGDQFYPSIAGIGTHSITYSYTAPNSCQQAVVQTAVVNSGSVLFSTPANPICANNPAPKGISITHSTVTSSTITISSSNGGSGTIGIISQMNGSGKDSINYYPGNSGLDTIVYLYYPDPCAGCVLQRAVSAVISVSPIPVISVTNTGLGAPSSICYGSTVNVILKATGASNYLWMPGGEVDDQVSKNPSTSGTTTYTVFGTANGCVGNGITTVTVMPLPTLSFSGLLASTGTVSPGNYCKNVDFNYTFTVSPWSGSAYGEFAPTNANVVDNLDGTALFNPNAISGASGDKNIIYGYTDPVTTCFNSEVFTVSIKNPPDPALDVPSSICFDASSVTLIGSVTTFTNSAYSLRTFGSNGFTSFDANDSLMFDPLIAGVATHTVVFSATSPSTGCSDSISQIIIVNALPVVDLAVAGLDTNYCESEASPYFMSGSPSGGLYATVGGAPGLNTNEFTPSLANIGITDIIYTYTNTTTGCVEDDTVSVVVNSLPTITYSGLDPSSGPNNYCSNVDLNYTFTVTPSIGGGGLFISTAANVTLLAGGQALFNPNNTGGEGVKTIKYQYTDALQCVNTDSFKVSVKDPPNTGFHASTVSHVCVNDTVELVGITNLTSLPDADFTFRTSSGGFVSPVSNDTVAFYGALVGVGTYSVTFMQTASYGCSDSTTMTIRVDALPVVDLSVVGTNTNFCKDDVSGKVMLGIPSGGNYTTAGSVPGISSGSFFPSSANLGVTDVIYTYMDINGCIEDDSISMTVHSLPTAAIEMSSQCNIDSINFSDASIANSIDNIQHWTWNFGDGTFVEALDTLQNTKHLYKNNSDVSFPIKLTVESGYGCINDITINKNITIPVLANFHWTNECNGDATDYITDNIDTSSVTVFWDFGDGNTSSLKAPSHTYTTINAYNVTMTVTTTGGCVNSLAKTLNIRPVIDLATSYLADFDNVSSGWSSKTKDSLDNWSMGTSSLLAPTSKAWYIQTYTVNNTVSYKSNEHSWVEGPCFDFTSTQRPMLVMKKRSEVEKARDGAVLQYSIDNATTWITLGTKNEKINWFNNESPLSGDPGGPTLDKNGWTGHESDWVEVRHDLDTLLNQPLVRFRIAFGSDGESLEANVNYYGFGFDDFEIKERSHKALLEHFTNASESTYNTLTDIVDDFVAGNKFINDVIDIQYHTGFPGEDNFNVANPSDPNTRVLYYGISPASPLTDIPYSIVDGNRYSVPLKYNTSFANPVSESRLIDAPLAIAIDTNKLANDSVVATLFTGNNVKQNQSVTVHIALLEKSNGMHQSILTKMVPNTAGFYLDSLKRNQTYTIKTSFGGTPWSSAGREVVVFVQDNASKEIYQAQTTQKYVTIATGIVSQANDGESISFMVFPNPSFEQTTILFSKPLTDDHNLQVFNQVGALVKSAVLQANSDRFSLSTNLLPPGMYYVRINSVTARNEVGHQKLIVVH